MYTIKSKNSFYIMTDNKNQYENYFFFNSKIEANNFIEGKESINHIGKKIKIGKYNSVFYSEEYEVIETKEIKNININKIRLEVEKWENDWSDHSHDFYYFNNIDNLNKWLNDNIIGWDDRGYKVFNNNCFIIGINDYIINK